MKSQRSAFPPVFWVANTIEILERFAYYGIYFGFGIYMTSLGLSTEKLGIVQSVFLFLSYGIPIFSGSMADRFGFKKVLVVSYLAYLPAIILLLLFHSYLGVLVAMLCIGTAAGIFKPLVAGTVRVVTDTTNKTLGFGVFYMMVNIGGFVGPVVAGYLRTISWDISHASAAVAIVVMFIITLLFYREPPREESTETLGDKLVGIWTVLTDLKFATFLVLLGLFFWLPFWGFFNVCALYIDSNLDTAAIYRFLEPISHALPWLGPWLLGIISHDEGGVRRILGESIGNTGLIIIVFQILVSRIFEKRRALPSFMFGLVVAAAGLATIGFAAVNGAPIVLLGVTLFAVGEMITSPRIQEYITWIAPKDKAGLYMGSNFIGTMIGAGASGVVTWVYGMFNRAGHPEGIWYVLAAHMVLAVVVFWLFARIAGEFKELDA